MSAALPIAPLGGLSVLAYLAAAVVLGFSFGFFLERAGFGSAKNLTSIFILRDFRVFRVLFSAVITGMLGLHLLGGLGVLELRLLEVGATFFWPMLAGGVVFGVGFYVGGFCPGTAAVALARGRWDGAVFLVGIALGIYGFALLFDGVGTEAWFAEFFAPKGSTEQFIYGDGPLWPWIVGLTGVALGAFAFVPFVEKRFALETVEQLEAAKAGREVPESRPPVLTGPILKVGPALAGALALGVLVLDVTGPEPVEAEVANPVEAKVAVDFDPSPELDPLSLASWVVVQAHRTAKKESPNAWILDLRPDPEVAIPGAEQLALQGDRDERLAAALTRLDGLMKEPGDRLEPVVLVDAAGERETARLVADLRRNGLDAMSLAGGFEAWAVAVLAEDAAWPKPAVRPDVVEPEGPILEGGSGDGQGALDGDAEDGLVDADEAAVGAQAEQEAKPEPKAPKPVDLDAVHAEIRAWLAGRSEQLPPRLNLPGVVLLPSRAATVVAKGGAGGGCG